MRKILEDLYHGNINPTVMDISVRQGKDKRLYQVAAIEQLE